jgi:hypothetical protein
MPRAHAAAPKMAGALAQTGLDLLSGPAFLAAVRPEVQTGGPDVLDDAAD